MVVGRGCGNKANLWVHICTISNLYNTSFIYVYSTHNARPSLIRSGDNIYPNRDFIRKYVFCMHLVTGRSIKQDLCATEWLGKILNNQIRVWITRNTSVLSILKIRYEKESYYLYIGISGDTSTLDWYILRIDARTIYRSIQRSKRENG